MSKKRTMRGWMLLAAITLFTSLLLAACGSSATNTPVAANPTTAAAGATTGASTGGNANVKGDVTVWAWNVAAKSLAANIEGFNKLYPNVKVKVEDIGRLDVYDKLTTGLAAGGTGLPDVVAIESDRMDVYTAKFPEGLADLTERAAKYEKDFDPSKWAQSKPKGKVRSIPWDSGPVGVFYRADFFEKAGVDATKIETWDDFIEAGKKVVAANPGVKMAAIDYTKDDALFRMILSQQGSYYFTADGKINLTSKEAVNAMNIIKKMKDADLLANVSGWDGLVGANKNSKVATQVFGVWWSGTISSEAPDLKGKWDVMAIPAVAKGGSRASNLGGSTLAIPAKSKNVDAAWAFIEYSLATKEGQNTMIKQFGIWPSYIPAYTDPFYTAPQAYFNNKPVWKLFTDQIPQLKPAYYTSDNDKGLAVAADAQGLVLSGTDPATALKKAADTLKQQTGRELVAGT
jgi:lactose/L-arabinose transport system substrate-binding protein